MKDTEDFDVNVPDAYAMDGAIVVYRQCYFTESKCKYCPVYVPVNSILLIEDNLDDREITLISELHFSVHSSFNDLINLIKKAKNGKQYQRTAIPTDDRGNVNRPT